MNFLRQSLVLLIGVAFLNANALSAHLHQCFDGKEPHTSLHVYDGEQDLHHANTAEKHNDRDIELTDQAIAKVFKFDPASPALLNAWAVPVVIRTASAIRFASASDQPLSSVHFLLLPQRGPPA